MVAPFMSSCAWPGFVRVSDLLTSTRLSSIARAKIRCEAVYIEPGLPPQHHPAWLEMFAWFCWDLKICGVPLGFLVVHMLVKVLTCTARLTLISALLHFN